MALIAGCSHPASPKPAPAATTTPPPTGSADGTASVSERPPPCPTGHNFTLHFYDVAQALAVLVDLPDGRHLLIDTGDAPQREGCGDICPRAHQHLLHSLQRDLAGAPLDLLWITHQHSDHIGGAPDVLATVPVKLYVDNGRDPTKAEVRRAREAAQARGAAVQIIDPEHPASPLPATAYAKLTPVVPGAWPRSCHDDENECSIALRIDACGVSALLTGDAEHAEEKLLDTGGPVTLLQVGHHGSETSTSPAFLSRTRPAYAVISAGKPDEGLNHEYCLPRALVVRRLTQALGGGASGTLVTFDGARCDRATPSDWVPVPTSEHLWATERDGDVVLRATPDGGFRRVPGL